MNNIFALEKGLTCIYAGLSCIFYYKFSFLNDERSTSRPSYASLIKIYVAVYRFWVISKARTIFFY